MRGHTLGQREVRRLLKRPGVRVLHAYGSEPREVSGSALRSLLGQLDEFAAGKAAPTKSFRVADFRNTDREVLLVVEESC